MTINGGSATTRASGNVQVLTGAMQLFLANVGSNPGKVSVAKLAIYNRDIGATAKAKALACLRSYYPGVY